MDLRSRLNRTPVAYGAVGRSNDEWPDHRLRALVTGSMLAWMRPDTVLDPACGDGSIVRIGAGLANGIQQAVLNDVGMPNIEAMASWLPDTWESGVRDLHETMMDERPFQVIVLTEILEHLEDPDLILRLAANKAQRILVSSPEMRAGQVDTNPEHLWMFDGEGYETMLNEAGWKVTQKTHLTFRSEYDFQIYVADRP